MSAWLSISDGIETVTPKLDVDLRTLSSFHIDRPDGELAAHRVGDAFGSLERGFWQEHQELFPAVPAFQIAAAQHVAHLRPDRRQNRVAAQAGAHGDR